MEARCLQRKFVIAGEARKRRKPWPFATKLMRPDNHAIVGAAYCSHVQRHQRTLRFWAPRLHGLPRFHQVAGLPPRTHLTQQPLFTDACEASPTRRARRLLVLEIPSPHAGQMIPVAAQVLEYQRAERLQSNVTNRARRAPRIWNRWNPSGRGRRHISSQNCYG